MATICIDLDGTLAEYHGWKGVENIGQPLAGAVEFVNGLAAKGYRIVIFTTRLNPSINRKPGEQDKAIRSVQNWLLTNGFTWHEIYAGVGKPMAEAYVDDRAVTCQPQKDNNAYSNALIQIENLISVKLVDAVAEDEAAVEHRHARLFDRHELAVEEDHPCSAI